MGMAADVVNSLIPNIKIRSIAVAYHKVLPLCKAATLKRSSFADSGWVE
ncbi:MAG: hypothetical protein ACJAVV_002499 [Alphaproteobacteria bacterium]|jgi:hypothetical protein